METSEDDENATKESDDFKVKLARGDGRVFGKKGIEESEEAYESIEVAPSPGLVLKTVTSGNQKLFINICQSSLIPNVSEKTKLVEEPVSGAEEEKESGSENVREVTGLNVPLSVGSLCKTKDKRGKACLVVDVIISVAFMREAALDRTKQKRQMLYQLCLEYIEKKYELELSRRVKFPRMNYKYQDRQHPVIQKQCIKQKQQVTIKEVNEDDQLDEQSAVEENCEGIDLRRDNASITGLQKIDSEKEGIRLTGSATEADRGFSIRESRKTASAITSAPSTVPAESPEEDLAPITDFSNQKAGQKVRTKPQKCTCLYGKHGLVLKSTSLALVTQCADGSHSSTEQQTPAGHPTRIELDAEHYRKLALPVVEMKQDTGKSSTVEQRLPALSEAQFVEITFLFQLLAGRGVVLNPESPPFTPEVSLADNLTYIVLHLLRCDVCNSRGDGAQTRASFEELFLPCETDPKCVYGNLAEEEGEEGYITTATLTLKLPMINRGTFFPKSSPRPYVCEEAAVGTYNPLQTQQEPDRGSKQWLLATSIEQPHRHVTSKQEQAKCSEEGTSDRDTESDFDEDRFHRKDPMSLNLLQRKADEKLARSKAASIQPGRLSDVQKQTLESARRKFTSREVLKETPKPPLKLF